MSCAPVQAVEVVSEAWAIYISVVVMTSRYPEFVIVVTSWIGVLVQEAVKIQSSYPLTVTNLSV